MDATRGVKVGERGCRRTNIENPPWVDSRGLIPSRCSSGSACSGGIFLGRVAQLRSTLRHQPTRSPLMLSVTSANCETNPNWLGLPKLALRIGLASGSCSETIRSLIELP